MYNTIIETFQKYQTSLLSSIQKIQGVKMSITNKINKLVLPIAVKVGNQRHLVAIRDTFVDITPHYYG